MLVVLRFLDFILNVWEKLKVFRVGECCDLIYILLRVFFLLCGGFFGRWWVVVGDGLGDCSSNLSKRWGDLDMSGGSKEVDWFKR